MAKTGRQTASDGRSDELARLYLTGDVSVEVLASEVGFRPYLVRARIHEWLDDRGVPKTHRTALTTCPIPPVRAAIWRLLTGEEVADLDPRFVTLIAETYTAPAYTWQQSWVAASLSRREGIAYVATYAPTPDEGVLHSDLCEALGVSATAGGHHSRIVATSTVAATSRPIVPALERTRPWQASLEADDRRVRLLRCPTCGTRPAWAFLRVPELNTNLVCPECRREPGGSIELPEAYARPWASARAGLHVYDTSVVRPDEVVAPNPILIAQAAVARRRRAA